MDFTWIKPLLRGIPLRVYSPFTKTGLVVRCSDRVVFPALTCLLFALTTKPLRVVTGLQVRGYHLHLRSKCWTRRLIRHDRDVETCPEEERGVTPVCTENSDSHSRPIVCLKLQRAVSGKSNSQSAFGASQ